ncbi:Imm32 family immunity protein [Dyella sp. Tek66A03]|uniref:Imm32 family immunity protein n=1 Tax=Dyella sp. Tek66A03 TaxID=3458298 RepID=UPI00403E3A82
MSATQSRQFYEYEDHKAEVRMKLFGYEEGNDTRQGPMKLSEASILANPAELRAIAKMLAEVAVEMEAEGFDHVHLSDRLPILGDGPDLIVAKVR